MSTKYFLSFTLFFVFVCTKVANSQNAFVKGVVIEKQTKQPVEFASI